MHACSLKFCTAIERPAPIRLAPRCCSSAFTSIALFGVLVAGTMALIRRWHKSNCIHHRGEVEHLLAIARRDKH